jgi:hypothetical protein
MREQIWRFGALAVVLTLLAGCGASIQPRVGTGGSDRPPGLPPEENLGPRPSPGLGGVHDERPIVDQVCRTRAMPSGWIAIRYAAGGDLCPASTDPDNPYTLAIIERHRQRPVGTTMVVCADQAVPSGWVREWNRETTAQCPGARVRADSPTTFMMRRVR